jgi:hypothetical protein
MDARICHRAPFDGSVGSRNHVYVRGDRTSLRPSRRHMVQQSPAGDFTFLFHFEGER